MRFFRWLLIIGGIFNFFMGLIFFSNRLIAVFFHAAVRAEFSLFGRTAVLFVPQDPVHLMLIHGFGAAALILGATLIYCFRDPLRYLPFILFDGAGRIIYGLLMIVYVLRYSLVRIILPFGIFELLLGFIYVAGSFWIARPHD